MGEIFDNYPKIKTFWDFLDETPELQGYNDGLKFKHKDGNIELKNINLSYDEKEILKDFKSSI